MNKSTPMIKVQVNTMFQVYHVQSFGGIQLFIKFRKFLNRISKEMFVKIFMDIKNILLRMRFFVVAVGF